MKAKAKCGTEFQIDKKDYDKYKDYTFHVMNRIHKGEIVCKYIYITDNGESKLLHRLIMGNPKKEVDHKDGDTLNNLSENLRLCTRSQNAKNRKANSNGTSKYKGVAYQKRGKRIKRWKAEIISDGQYYFLGYYKDQIDAAKAYDKKANELHGEFARTNKDLGLL